jgi:hypothetical protein
MRDVDRVDVALRASKLNRLTVAVVMSSVTVVFNATITLDDVHPLRVRTLECIVICLWRVFDVASEN